MTQTYKCPRLGQTDTTNYFLWECEQKKIFGVCVML